MSILTGWLGIPLHAAKDLNCAKAIPTFFSGVLCPSLTWARSVEKLCPTLHSRFLAVILVTFAEVSSAFAEDVKIIKCLFRVCLPFPILLVNGACVDLLWPSVWERGKLVSIRFLVPVFESQQIAIMLLWCFLMFHLGMKVRTPAAPLLLDDWRWYHHKISQAKIQTVKIVRAHHHALICLGEAVGLQLCRHDPRPPGRIIWQLLTKLSQMHHECWKDTSAGLDDGWKGHSYNWSPSKSWKIRRQKFSESS